MINITQQTTDYNCGPTALAAVYLYFDEPQIVQNPKYIEERLQYISEEHGTYDVALALDALNHGYNVIMNVYNMNIFDYTWHNNTDELIQHLKIMLDHNKDEFTDLHIRLYIKFLENGGHINISPNVKFMLSSYISNKHNNDGILLCALSATALYRCSRVNDDDYSPYGKLEGHFVVMDIDDAWYGNPKIYDPYGLKSCYSNLEYNINQDTFYQALLQGTHTHDGTVIEIYRKK